MEDEGDNSLQPRPCDDMLNRRLGNVPAPLRKKKLEEHKKFITPSGDPLSYIKQQRMSKSTSNLDTAGLKDQQERNERYEQLQTLKQQLREEEETWTSKLQDWKSRRRSVTSTLRERKEDREQVEKMTSGRQLRRHKTYAEMLEDKRRREESFDASSSSSSTTGQEPPVAPPRYSTSHKLDDGTTAQQSGRSGKQPYRGAKSSPMLNVDDAVTSRSQNSNNNNNKKNVTSSSSSSSSDEGDSKVVDGGKRNPLLRQSPVTYTSKTVVTVTKKDDVHQSPPIYKAISPRYAPRQSASLPRGASLSAAPASWRRDLSPQKSPENQHHRAVSSSVATTRNPPPAAQVAEKKPVAVTSASATVVQPNTSSPAYRVVMRRKNNNNSNNNASAAGSNTANRARPKSAYSVLDTPSTTSSVTTGGGLPSNYHEYSSPKPYGTSRFVQYRKSMFASKRNLWENRSVDNTTSAAASNQPKPLSALLQQDTERLSQNVPDKSPPPPPTNNSNTNNNNSTSWRRPSADNNSNTPRFGGNMRSQTLPRQWARPASAVATSNGVTNKFSFPAKSTSIEPVASAAPPAAPPVKTQVAKKITMTSAAPPPPPPPPPPSYQPPVIGDEKKFSPELDAPVPAPAAPASKVDVAMPPSSTAEDMKICIIQKPRSAKGFGFTVRGGDDGKPVIVDTVNPGGAADICQLCVGDEILAINDVQLASLKTQDGIVQLIVDSIITGNLALNIRRFQKAKKVSPLRLTGTKVVMTSGGFVQLRSDRNFSPNANEKVISPSPVQRDDDVIKPPTPPPPPPLDEEDEVEEFPPPPEDLLSPPPVDPPQEIVEEIPVIPAKRSVHQSRFFAQAAMRKSIDDLTLNNNHHHHEEEDIDDEKVAWRENDNYPSDDDDDVTSSSDDDGLQREMQEVRRQLETEHSFVPNSAAPSSGNGDFYHHQHSVAPAAPRNSDFKQKLLDDQRRLEEEELRREQHRRLLAQQAHEEEQQVQLQLRKIEMQKQESSRRREMEKQRLMDSNFAYTGLRTKTSSITSQGQFRHWLLDEAERSRLAEGEGRQRATALEPTTAAAANNQQQANSGVLPAHVIQRLTQQQHAAAPSRGEMNGGGGGGGGYSPHATLL